MVKNFNQAQDFLFQQIPRGRKNVYTKDAGIKRTRLLLALLGNPDHQLRVIHVAGTSGKGSTAYLTSIMLRSLGCNVGLHLSPHLLDIRERCQVNNRLVSKKEFVRCVNALLPAFNAMQKTVLGTPTYFELLTVLALYVFAKKRVDYAVIETGIGGLYDTTNAPRYRSKFSLITKIGFDHMRTLGNTLAKIATQKAGIITVKGDAVVVNQKPTARKSIAYIAGRKQAKLFWLEPDIHWSNVQCDQKRTMFDFSFCGTHYKRLALGLLGTHQAENCACALAAIVVLATRDGIQLQEAAIRHALSHAQFPGRCDLIRKRGKTIVIDGAHNPQKMQSLINTLTTMFPGKKFDFLIAFKHGKEYRQMISLIKQHARRITVTAFYPSAAQPALPTATSVGVVIREIRKSNHVASAAYTSPQEALLQALAHTREVLVVAGSFYLISQLYRRIAAES
ncbi:MAG: hypothetical protein HY006_02075 [Candidatus Sungbacteria bacterium]|nr:hypothetical protein [Candidatus Sungbacteria bacterium]